MTTNLNAHRLLREYQSLAAGGYPGGRRAFSRLADLASNCLSNVTSEQRLPAMILQNVFHTLSQEQENRADQPGAGPVVPPELHAALVTALEFIVAGGDPSGCIRVSERVVQASRQLRAETSGDKSPRF